MKTFQITFSDTDKWNQTIDGTKTIQSHDELSAIKHLREEYPNAEILKIVKMK